LRTMTYNYRIYFIIALCFQPKQLAKLGSIIVITYFLFEVLTSKGSTNFWIMTETCILLYRANLKVNSSLLKIICKNLHHTIAFSHCIWILWVVSAENPHETTLVLLGTPRGLTACCIRSMQSCFPTKMDLS